MLQFFSSSPWLATFLIIVMPLLSAVVGYALHGLMSYRAAVNHGLEYFEAAKIKFASYSNSQELLKGLRSKYVRANALLLTAEVLEYLALSGNSANDLCFHLSFTAGSNYSVPYAALDNNLDEGRLYIFERIQKALHEARQIYIDEFTKIHQLEESSKYYRDKVSELSQVIWPWLFDPIEQGLVLQGCNFEASSFYTMELKYKRLYVHALIREYTTGITKKVRDTDLDHANSIIRQLGGLESAGISATQFQQFKAMFQPSPSFKAQPRSGSIEFI